MDLVTYKSPYIFNIRTNNYMMGVVLFIFSPGVSGDWNICSTRFLIIFTSACITEHDDVTLNVSTEMKGEQYFRCRAPSVCQWCSSKSLSDGREMITAPCCYRNTWLSVLFLSNINRKPSSNRAKSFDIWRMFIKACHHFIDQTTHFIRSITGGCLWCEMWFPIH